MGWPKKNEGFRLYFERKAKTYLLIEIPDPEVLEQERKQGYYRRGYEGVGEIMVHNDPESPKLASCNPSDMHLYRKCRRVQWSDMPQVWQDALASWINGDPKDFRGLWKVA
jgi:hypothetical protein